MDKMDTMKISQEKDVIKDLEKNGIIPYNPEKIILSSKLTKINHVNKKQERILLLTDKNLYNLLPTSTLLGLFTRIKRKIPYSNIVSMTVSRFGHEFVIHVQKEHDYRFSSPNMKLRIVETLVDCWCKYHKKKMPLYYYDDLTLEVYTTTINDLDLKKRKDHPSQPLYLDSESMKVLDKKLSKTNRPKLNPNSFLKMKITKK